MSQGRVISNHTDPGTTGRPLRIALVNISLDPGRGSDLVVMELGRRLAEAHSVQLFSLRPTAADVPGCTVSGPALARTLSGRLCNLVRHVQSMRASLNAVDVCNSHHAVVSLVLPKVRLVTTYHGFVGRLNRGWGNRTAAIANFAVRRCLVAPALRRSRSVTIVSGVLMDEVTRALGHAPHVVPNGVEIEAAPNSLGQPGHFLYVGRIDREKNVEGLIQCFLATGSDSRLVIAGEGSLRSRLEERYACSRVEFVGRVERHNLPALFADAYAFITACEIETFCIPAVEAAQLGVPTIGPRSGALPEVVADGETGWLLEDFARDLDQALRKVESMNRADRDQIAGRCLTWGRRFTWSAAIAGYEKVYRSIP